MFVIVLCGERDDSRILSALLSALKARGKVVFVDGGALTCDGGGDSEFLLYHCEKLPDINYKNAVFLLKKSADENIGRIPHALAAVVSSDTDIRAGKVCADNVPVVSCGMRLSDTLTLSSVMDDGGVITVQRGLRTVSGRLIEQGDLAFVSRYAADPYVILSVAAVLLLTDNADLTEPIVI